MTNTIKWQTAAVLCLTILVLGQVSVSAATFYVSTTGNDTTGTGSSTKPWATIDFADKNSRVVAGDLVLVSAGDYTLSGTVAINTSMCPGVTYKANGVVTIHLTNGSGSASTGWQVGAANTVIDGFKISGEGASGHGGHVLVSNTSGFEMKNCTISSAKTVWKSICLRGVKNSYVHNNVIGPLSVEPNVVTALSEDNCDQIGGNRYYNNTIANVYGWAVDFAGSNLDRAPREFKNNIVYKCLYGIWAQDSLDLCNNFFYGTLYDNYTYSGTSTGQWAMTPIEHQVRPGPNDKTLLDPLFDGTYHLTTVSPCIDAGQFVGLPYNGVKPDVGAFESAGTAHPGDFGTISGRVTDGASGPGLEGAVVKSAASDLITTTSDANGNYTLALPAGSNNVSASIVEYQTMTLAVNVVAGTQTVNFPLQLVPPVTYYVSPSGNDSNTGSISSPWKTIDNGDKKGLLRCGDTVVVMTGDYNLTTDPGVKISTCTGRDGKPITYRAQAGVTVRGTSTGCAFSVDAPAEYIIVDGFTFSSAKYPLAINNTVGCEVANCVVTNAGVATDNGGIWINNSADCLVHNNLIGPLSIGGSHGLYADNGSGGKYYNNTIVSCGGSGVVFMGSNLLAELKNNIISGCSTGIYGGNTGVVHTNNMLFGCTSNYMGGIAQGSAESTDLNPALDASYHLLSSSPAVDAGVDVGLAYSGFWPDLGAFESSFSPTFTTLRGRVTSVSTGSPVVGAAVSAGPTGNCGGATDTNGDYVIQAPVGPQTVTVSHIAYNTAARAVTVSSPSTAADFQLAQASARIYYVSPIGNDSYSGLSPEDAWESVDNGDRNHMLNPGDTVIALAGNYYSAAPVVIENCSGTPDKPITYVASGGTPVIDGEVAASGFTIQGPAGYVVLDGFRLTGSEFPLTLSNTVGCEVKNGRISTEMCAAEGLWVTNSSSCKIHHNIIGPNLCVYGAVTSCGLSEEGGNGNEFCNNTIVSMSGWGVDFSQPSSGRVLKNNIMYSCAKGIYCTATGATHSHNVQFGTTSYPFYGGIAPAPGESSNFDPRFIDAANDDFHLQTVAAGYPVTSAGVDGGTIIGQPFKGLWPDLGAYEADGTAYPGVGAITGRVTEVASGLGIRNAQISTGARTNAYAYADADGYYTLQLPVRTLNVTASRTNYANSVKSVVVAEGTQTVNFQLVGPRVVKRLSSLRGISDGTRVSINDPMIATTNSSTFTGPTVFYIEQPDRTSGVRIVPRSGLAAVVIGDNVTLTGYVFTDANGEQYIDCESIDSKVAGTPITALGVGSRSIVSLGPVLVRTWGTVRTRTADYLYLDDGNVDVNDGTGNGPGVRVRLSGLNVPITKTIGSFLTVTGIVGKSADGSVVIIPRGDADIN